MRVAVNCLGLFNGSKMGAREVLFNVCRGWAENGHDNNLVFFCYPGELCENLKKICPNAEYVEWDLPTTHQGKYIRTMINQTLYFHKRYKKYNLDRIFFPQAGTGLFKYNVPVTLNPHDIQFVSHPELYQGRHPIRRYVYWKLFYQCNFRVANAIISISNVDKAEISQCYPKCKDKIHMIYDPIVTNASNVGSQNKDKTIIATNIQHEHKNTLTLIKAYALIMQKYPEYKLYLIGKKNDYVENTLVKYVKEHKLEQKVIFTGILERDELENLWKKTSLYVNPTLYEGFGMTAVESLIFGAPTLLSDLEVSREVTENRAEFYAPPEDEKVLADKIKNMLQRTYHLDEIVDCSLRMQEKYDYKKISEKYWELLVK